MFLHLGQLCFLLLNQGFQFFLYKLFGTCSIQQFKPCVVLQVLISFVQDPLLLLGELYIVAKPGLLTINMINAHTPECAWPIIISSPCASPLRIGTLQTHPGLAPLVLLCYSSCDPVGVLIIKVDYLLYTHL